MNTFSRLEQFLNGDELQALSLEHLDHLGQGSSVQRILTNVEKDDIASLSIRGTPIQDLLHRGSIPP